MGDFVHYFKEDISSIDQIIVVNCNLEDAGDQEWHGVITTLRKFINEKVVLTVEKSVSKSQG